MRFQIDYTFKIMMGNCHLTRVQFYAPNGWFYRFSTDSEIKNHIGLRIKML